MIIIWDCKAGRREFITLILKKESWDCYEAATYSKEIEQEIALLTPKLIICSNEISTQLSNEITCPIWVLGKEVELPIKPLALIKQIYKIYKK